MALNGFVRIITISAIAVTFVVFVIAPAIAIFNFVIAKIFLKKKKKLPSDYLIITGLIGDGIYGIMIFSIPFAYMVSKSVFAFLSETAYICIVVIYLFLDSALTLFSLFMVFFMTINRFVAVEKPFRYKKYFNQSNVHRILFVVSFVCIFFFTVLSLLFFKLSLKRNEETNMYQLDEKFIFIFISMWPQVQLLLVFIDSVLMVYVYAYIARTYRLSITEICCRRKPKRQKANLKTADVDEMELQPDKTGDTCKAKGLRANSKVHKWSKQQHLMFSNGHL